MSKVSSTRAELDTGGRRRPFRRETWDIQALFKSPNNERDEPITQEALERLSEQIKENGLLNEPLITPDGGVFSGWNRVKACKKAGINKIPVKVYDDLSPEEQQDMSLSENVARTPLSDTAVERSVVKRIELEWGNKEIARRTGINRDKVQRIRFVYNAEKNGAIDFGGVSKNWTRKEFRAFKKSYERYKPERPDLNEKQLLEWTRYCTGDLTRQTPMKYYRLGPGPLPSVKNVPSFDSHGDGYTGQTAMIPSIPNKKKVRVRKMVSLSDDGVMITFGVPENILKKYHSYANTRKKTYQEVMVSVLCGRTSVKDIMGVTSSE